MTVEMRSSGQIARKRGRIIGAYAHRVRALIAEVWERLDSRTKTRLVRSSHTATRRVDVLCTYGLHP